MVECKKQFPACLHHSSSYNKRKPSRDVPLQSNPPRGKCQCPTPDAGLKNNWEASTEMEQVIEQFDGASILECLPSLKEEDMKDMENTSANLEKFSMPQVMSGASCDSSGSEELERMASSTASYDSSETDDAAIEKVSLKPFDPLCLPKHLRHPQPQKEREDLEREFAANFKKSKVPNAYLNLTKNADDRHLPKEQRPAQPNEERQACELIWYQNLKKSQAAAEGNVYVSVADKCRLLKSRGSAIAMDEKSGSQYVVYRFEMESSQSGKQWTIYRRFQEFKQLHDRMKSEGYQLPNLPPKTFKRCFDQEFVQWRENELYRWMKELLEPPVTSSPQLFKADIHDSDTLRNFLTYNANTPPAMVAKKKSSSSSSSGGLPSEESSCSHASKLIAPFRSLHQKPSNVKEPSQGKVSVEDFELLCGLGKGAYGRVFLVRKKDTRDIFAMKCLSKPRIVKTRQVEHTRTERRVLGNMQHPFIVRLYYAFQTAHKLYFILDYCPGGDIFYHLQKRRSFPEPWAKFYVAEIVLALIHLHEQDVVYRDLKPENILLDVEGHVKLADFGLAKEGITQAHGGTHTMCGTPEYLPPEILNRNGHGTAVDWWNLGMVLYELMIGRPPWYSTDREVLYHGLRNGTLVFPERGLSLEAKSFISGLLERDPAKRLGSRCHDDILQHPFFLGVDWERLYHRKYDPPIQPCKGLDILSATNFEEVFTSVPVKDNIDEEEITPSVTPSGRNSAFRQVSYNPTFQDFTFEAPSNIHQQ